MAAFLSGALAAAVLLTGAAASAAPLSFTVQEGRNLNALVREGPVAAHLVLRDGTDPRLLVAFPAGNSGVAAWFAPAAKPVVWRLDALLQPVTRQDARGRPLRGITGVVQADTPELDLGRVVVGSVRSLRDYEALHTAPADLTPAPRQAGTTITWARDRLDGAAGYLLSLDVLDGSVSTEGGRTVLKAAGGRALRLRLTALTGETPLTPLDVSDILTAAAGRDPRARESLAFLSYREKLLAGSWRFDTYFGRDTLMSVRLLLPVLKPEEAEAGLGAVLERLSPTGEVAHEEGVGEFAVIDNEKAGRGAVATPTYDYKMIDADYMLAPVLQAYAERFGQARLTSFLARRAPGGEAYGALLMRNLRHVIDSARPFAEAPSAAALIHLKPDVPVGEWRDSNTGLAGGRIPYDVNAVFVPAALSAIDRLRQGGALTPYLGSGEQLEGAGAMAARWRTAAPSLFSTTVEPAQARADVARFAAESGVEPGPALASLPAGPLVFPALSLDASGRPIPVLNSDIGFDLLFGQPDASSLATLVADVMRPFPAGLMTGVGAVVADAAYADTGIRKDFSKAAYHGAVVWAWQEAVLIAGLDRQLERGDLSPALRRQLGGARDRLWAAVQAVGETRTSELWSWTYSDGRYRVEAFGAGAKDADESNAAQLWSTVFLALKARTPDAR